MRLFPRVRSALLCCTVLLPGCDKSGQLKLDCDAFDQQPGQGLRQLAETGRVLDAAKLIDNYIWWAIQDLNL
jgi:hypothetical protein